MPIDYSTLSSLVPPALALALLAYFVRFFGKIIADQKPFTDNREWEIELGGVMFMINLSPGLIGIIAALRMPMVSSYWFAHLSDFLLISLVLGLTYLANSALSQRFFNIKIDHFLGSKELFNWCYKLGKKFPLWLVAVISFFFGAIEGRVGDAVWILLTWPLILYTLVTLASLYSLRKMMTQERVGVDVYFVDKTTRPLKNVTILKFNDDNVRLRHGDTVLIINKDQVLKFEMLLPEAYRPDTNRSGKNLT